MYAKVLNFFEIKIFFLISFILFKAPPSRGFSVSETSKYIEKAKALALWNDPKWIRLGHYEKTLFGLRSSFRGPLFIHPEGYNSPEAELIETLQAFLSDSKVLTEKFGRHPQCQFLARRTWLFEKLNVNKSEILNCAEREEWIKKLGATSVSLIFASADLGNPASGFGHTFLKLINPQNAKNKDLLDYGVNYAADGDQSEGFFYAFKGLFGMYSGRFTMLPFHQKIREYINLEGRDIWEYGLTMNSAEVDELIAHLLELDGSVSPYYFFSNNCSYQLLLALDAVKPELELSREHTLWVNPIDTVKTLNRKLNLISVRNYKPSLKTAYLSSFAKLNTKQKVLLDKIIKTSTTISSNDLDKVEKALVYETAAKYISVKAYQTQDNFDEVKYKIALARAVLGPITDEDKVQKPSPPESSHDSSAMYLGYGKNLASDYASFKFRATFHDLEQNDSGIVHFSQNTVGALEFRYYSEIRKLSLERATLLNLLNTNPVTEMDNNFSWKVRLDVLDRWRPDIEFGGGFSLNSQLFRTSRLAFFLTSRFAEAEKKLYQAGPEILFITRPFENLGFSIDATYFAAQEAVPYLRFTTKIDLQLATHLDLQLQANDQKDYQLNFVQNFIF